VYRFLPATLDPNQVALLGLHSWTEDDFPNVGRWGIRLFRPDDLHLSSKPLLDWLKASGCSCVAIHFDVARAWGLRGIGFLATGLVGMSKKHLTYRC
jgi:hypothetical protein